MDINERIEANLGLVYNQLHKFRLADDPDAESFAYEAIYNAAKTYDEQTGVAFSTYATCVISNAIRMHIRHLNRKRQLQTISYYTPLSSEDDSGYLVDTLSTQESAESDVILNELHSKVPGAISKVLKDMPPKQRKAVLMWRSTDYKASQTEIAKAIGVSQAAVSRAISSFKYKLKLELEEYL